MFEKEHEQGKRPGNTETVIGPSVIVKGDFVGEGDVRIEGRVEGTFETKNNLTVGKGAQITATVKVRNIFIAGKVNGNVKATEKTELSKTSKVSGDIETKSLAVEDGAVFNGNCVMSKEDAKSPRENKVEKEEKIGPPPIR